MIEYAPRKIDLLIKSLHSKILIIIKNFKGGGWSERWLPFERIAIYKNEDGWHVAKQMNASYLRGQLAAKETRVYILTGYLKTKTFGSFASLF